MHQFVQTLINGLTTGALYALLALGYTMVYGVLQLLNFAHGDVYMVGAYIGYFVLQGFGGGSALIAPVWLVVLVMLVAGGLGSGFLGVAIERFAYRSLRNAPRIATLITALGVSFVLENAVLLLFGGNTRSYDTSTFISFGTGIHVGVFNVDAVQLLVFGASALMMWGLVMLVSRTTMGKSIRAVASDREAAEMVGIDVDRTIVFTFFVGSVMAGVAGVLSGLVFNQISNTFGFLAGLYAFTAAVVGSIGSIPGAMIGGVVIGLCESFASGYVSTQYTDLIVFGILIVVMLIKPTGILGRAVMQKV